MLWSGMAAIDRFKSAYNDEDEDARLANAEVRLRAAEAPPPAGSSGEDEEGLDRGGTVEGGGTENPADRNPEVGNKNEG